MNIDVICLTKTSNEDLYQMTLRTLGMLHDSEKDYTFKVYLVESGKLYDYSNLVTNYITPNIPFNYNKFINICYPYVTSDWVLVINNDLRFERGWFNKIVEVHNKRADIEAFSPKCPILYAEFFNGHFIGTNEEYHENYKITEFLTGWCLVIKRRVFDLLYPWDEQFDMYYQDNDYAKRLELLGIKHALVRDSIVSHLGSKTANRKFDEIKFKQDELKFRTKWNIWD
jgi:hypothetical protein